jgi:hypothetical protein
MVKGITTLPKRKMFPAGVLLPSESEIFTAQLEANLSQGPKKKGRSNPEHTQQALFAEKLRRDNFKKPLFHPQSTAHRESIAMHQDLRNLQSVTDKLQAMLHGLSNAPQIRHKFLNRKKQLLLRDRRLALARSDGGPPYSAEDIFGDDDPPALISPLFSEMGEIPGPRRSTASRLNPGRMADRGEGLLSVASAQQVARLQAAQPKAPPGYIQVRRG